MLRPLTWVLRLLPVVGAVLVAVGLGLFGELPQNWWDQKGFITNVASGIVSACFGIPLAFFVLQKMLANRQDRKAVVEAATLASRSVADLRVTAIHFIGMCDRDDYDMFFYRLREILKAMKILHHYICKHYHDEAILTEIDKRTVDSAAVALSDWGYDLRQRRKEVGGIPDENVMLSRIRFIAGEVNARLMAQDLPPLTPGHFSILEKYVASAYTTPLHRLLLLVNERSRFLACIDEFRSRIESQPADTELRLSPQWEEHAGRLYDAVQRLSESDTNRHNEFEAVQSMTRLRDEAKSTLQRVRGTKIKPN